MSTEVVHGPRPKFKAKLQPGRYRIVVEGRYTATPGLTAAGVKAVTWNSDRPAKRRNEMLGLRTAFLCWFIETWVAQGGTFQGAVIAVKRYPWERILKRIPPALRPRRPLVFGVNRSVTKETKFPGRRKDRRISRF